MTSRLKPLVLIFTQGPKKTLLPTILKTAGRSMQQYSKENKAKDKDPGEFS